MTALGLRPQAQLSPQCLPPPHTSRNSASSYAIALSLTPTNPSEGLSPWLFSYPSYLQILPLTPRSLQSPGLSPLSPGQSQSSPSCLSTLTPSCQSLPLQPRPLGMPLLVASCWSYYSVLGTLSMAALVHPCHPVSPTGLPPSQPPCLLPTLELRQLSLSLATSVPPLGLSGLIVHLAMPCSLRYQMIAVYLEMLCRTPHPYLN